MRQKLEAALASITSKCQTYSPLTIVRQSKKEFGLA